MAEELQALLERINREYLLQAETRRNEMISEAEKQAGKLLSDARAEADRLKIQAEEAAAQAAARAEAAARQAARDIVLALRTELQTRLERAVRASAAAALSPELMAELLKTMAASGEDKALEVLASGRDAGKLQALLQGTLAAGFRETPQIFPDRNIRAGMQVAVRGTDTYIDITDEAVSDLLKSYLGPELGRLLEAR